MKRLAQVTITIIATLLGFVLLWEFRPALQLFGGSLALSATLRPLVARLEKRGVARSQAILLWYVLLLALLGFVLFVFGSGISGELAIAIEMFPSWYSNLREQLSQGGMLGQSIATALPVLSASSSSTASLVGGTAIGLLSGSIAQIVLLLAMLSLSFYWLSEVTHFERLWLSLLPVAARVRARDIWRNADTAVGAYIRASLVAVLCSGLLLLGGYYLIDAIPGLSFVPFTALLALLGGISHLVPRIGPTVMLLVTTAVTATLSIPTAVVVFVFGAIIHYAAHMLATSIVNTEFERVNPLLQVLLLMALFEVGGLSAIIFAPPLAALIQVLNNTMRLSGIERNSEEQVLNQLSGRLQKLEDNVDTERKEFCSALRRSQELLEQARGLLKES